MSIFPVNNNNTLSTGNDGQNRIRFYSTVLADRVQSWYLRKSEFPDFNSFRENGFMEQDPRQKDISQSISFSAKIEPESSGFADFLSLFRSKEGVPTDLSHLYLNEKNEAWANLGYWKDTTQYGNACKDLAKFLGRLAELSSETKLLDIGFGCGEQFRIWEKEFEVPLKNITGTNISKSQFKFTKDRYSNTDSIPNLILGGSEVLTEFADKSFDRIIALDSFYFVPNRNTVISEIYRILKPGGVFVSAEIFLSDRKIPFWEELKRSAIVWGARIPRSGLTSAEKIIASYSSQGFLFEVLDRIDPYVFWGFSEFLLSHMKNDSKIPKNLKARYKMFGEYLGSESIKKHFEYWVYKVRKPKIQSENLKNLD